MLTRSYPYKVWETDHFLIHYYEENHLLLEETAKNLEAAYEEITAVLDAKPNRKLPFFLYTTHNEFEENRIVAVGEGTGGVTEAFKDRFLVFHDGTLRWLRHVIFHEFTHEIEFAILNAGFWKSARLLKSILYPLWIMEGMAEYFAGDIDKPTDLMYARDAATSQAAPAFKLKDLHNFNHLKPHQVTKAYKQSASVMEFIAEEYGREKLGLLLKAYRERFDITAVLLDVLGLDLDRFDRNYREWLEEKYDGLKQNLDEPVHYGAKLTASLGPLPTFRHSPVFAPDGSSIYYIALREGFPAIYEQQVAGGKTRIILGRQFKHFDWIALEERNLALSADGRYLYFIAEKKQKDYLYRYDLKTDDLARRAVGHFTALKSPHVNPLNPDELVLAAMENGFFDLLIFDFKTGSMKERVTADPQDDDYPVYLPDGSGLIYSTEIGLTKEGRSNRDLYLWQRRNRLAQRLTQGPLIEKTPAISSDGERVIFISDAGDAWDVYELSRSSGVVLKLTRTLTGIFSPSYKPATDAIMFAALRDGEIDVYLGERRYFLNEDVSSSFLAMPGKSLESVPLSVNYKGAYKSHFGTDLFFPALFFSTEGGLFALGYWQGSDLLGYHNVAGNLVLNTGSSLVDYSLDYTYSRWRPELSLIVKGAQIRDFAFISDQGENLRKREHLQMLVAGYPLDRFNRLETGVATAQRFDTFPSETEAISNYQEFRVLWRFVHDTTTAPYLVVTRGRRVAVGWRRAFDAGTFNLDYGTRFLEWHEFLPLMKDSTLGSRLVYKYSLGRDFEAFPLGGVGQVRGYPRERESERRRATLVHNLEFRFPLVPDLNYHMWYMFPDFYIKNIYLGLFSDQGVRFNDGARALLDDWPQRRRQDFFHAVGVSLKLNTFILETFPFFFSFEWAERTTRGGSIFYGSIAQYFKF